jgi:hypothetical protein
MSEQRGNRYVVNLKDRNDPYADWFESDIEGAYDYCHSQVRLLLLDSLFQIQIRERKAVMSEQEFYDRLRKAFEGTNITFDHMDDLGDYIAEGERCVSFFGVETKEVES